jgi:hypothetical protein
MQKQKSLIALIFPPTLVIEKLFDTSPPTDILFLEIVYPESNSFAVWPYYEFPSHGNSEVLE